MTQNELQDKANDLKVSIEDAVIKFNTDTGLTPKIDIIISDADAFLNGNEFISVRVKVNVDLC